jgi:hypothetical protein
VRSSLWRSIAAVKGEPAPSGDAPSETEAETETAGSGTAPVLALFRRLPLLDDDPDAE